MSTAAETLSAGPLAPFLALTSLRRSQACDTDGDGMLDLFEIISYASRAFAAYYAVQSLIAAATAWHADKRGHKLLAAGFLLLAILGAVIVIFGRPVE